MLGLKMWQASRFSPDIQDKAGSAYWKWVESNDDDSYKKLLGVYPIPEKMRSLLRQRYAQATADKTGTDRQVTAKTIVGAADI
mmetsp:Transcript_74611/g.147808  ORF Transcript_74611/g.147808 Transcript_74611/m.147808 type:complete len:83 (-) Transcript_74611:100-348(-)